MFRNGGPFKVRHAMWNEVGTQVRGRFPGKYWRVGAIGLFVSMMGLMELAGWLWMMGDLKNLIPGSVGVTFQAALGLVMVGMALFLWGFREAGAFARWGAIGASLLTVAIGMITPAEYLFGLDEEVMQAWLLDTGVGGLPLDFGGMSVFTATAFVLAGVGLILADFRRCQSIVQAGALSVGVMTAWILGAHAFGGIFFPPSATAPAMGAHTALGFLLVAVGIVAGTSHAGIIGRWRGRFRAIGFGAAMGALIIASAAVFVGEQRDRVAIDWVEHTYQVLNQLEKIRSETRRFEGILDRFLLTGNPERVREGRLARNALLEGIEQSRRLTADNPTQQRRLDQLAPLAGELFALVMPHLQERGGVTAPRSPRFPDIQGINRVTGRIAGLTADMLAVEQRLLQQRWEIYKMQNAATTITQVLTLVAGLAMLGFVFRGLWREVAEHRLTTAALEAEQNFASAVFDSTPALVIIHDREGRIVRLNKAAAAVAGYTLEELAGKITWKLMMADPAEQEDTKARYVALQTMTCQEAFVTFGHGVVRTWRTKKGAERRIHWQLAYLPDPRGKVAFQVASGLDITESEAAAHALKESEERFRTVAEAMPIPLIVTRLRDRTLVYSNREADRFFAGKGNTLIGTDPARLWVVPEAREKMFRLLELKGTIRGLEIKARLYNGEEKWVASYVERLSYEGEPAIISGILDVSERRRVERLKDEFVATLNHELRTPLTSIIGSLGIVEGMHGDQLSPEVAELVSVSRRNSDHLVRLIGDLLDIQKIETGNLILQKTSVDMRHLLAHAASVNEGYAQKFGISLVVKENLPDCRVMGDWDRLTQVLANLISNAVKFSEKGTTVEIDLLAEGTERARVMVSDHGKGIPEEFRSRIFEKFSQADSSDSRSKEGTGLGLSISKAIVESHDGVIDFISTPGQGSSFFFELPLLDSVAL